MNTIDGIRLHFNEFVISLLVIRLLFAYVTRITWDNSKFRSSIATVAAGYWKLRSNQRELMDAIAKKLNISHPDGWYKIKGDTLRQHGAKTVLDNYYNGSISKLLTKVYPEYEIVSNNSCRVPWDMEKFRKCSRLVKQGHWSDRSNQRKFMDDLAKRLRITDPDGWYSVSYDTVCKHGGSGILSYSYGGSVYKLLKAVYPG